MNYNCKNRDHSCYDWICFCPVNGSSYKETLERLNNVYIQELIELKRSKINSMTEAEIQEVLKFLESEANFVYQMWLSTC